MGDFNVTTTFDPQPNHTDTNHRPTAGHGHTPRQKDRTVRQIIHNKNVTRMEKMAVEDYINYSVLFLNVSEENH